MGLKPSKCNLKESIDIAVESKLELLRAELELDIITRVSAEMNHKMFELEKNFDDQMSSIKQIVNDIESHNKMLGTSLTLQSQEIEVLHKVKKNKGFGFSTIFPRL